MRIDVKIMSVLSRKKYACELAKTIEISNDNIVFDDRGINGGGSAWYNAKRIWSLDTNGFSHRLVLQDDILLCNDFLNYVEKCVEKYPDVIWTFYNGVWIKPEFKRKDTPYTIVKGGALSGQAVCIPIQYIQNMIEWTDEILGYDFKHDDGRIGFYSLCNDIPVMCTIPSLVNHDNDVKSCIPNHNNRNRRSSTFYDPKSENWDSEEINYTTLLTNEIWLPKNHPRKGVVETMKKNAITKERSKYK